MGGKALTPPQALEPSYRKDSTWQFKHVNRFHPWGPLTPPFHRWETEAQVREAGSTTGGLRPPLSDSEARFITAPAPASRLDAASGAASSREETVGQRHQPAEHLRLCSEAQGHVGALRSANTPRPVGKQRLL